MGERGEESSWTGRRRGLDPAYGIEPDTAADLDPGLKATLDRDADLDEMRDGGPVRSPGAQTTRASRTVIGDEDRLPRAAANRQPRPGAAPTTTGDATTGGMDTETGMGTSDANSTGQVGGVPRAGSKPRE